MNWMYAVGVLSLFSAACMSVVVLSHDIQEGVIIKASLILMILSLLATSAMIFTIGEAGSTSYWGAAIMLRTGLAGLCLGVMVRAKKMGDIRRKAESDAKFRNRTRSLLQMMVDQVADISELFNHSDHKETSKHG